MTAPRAIVGLSNSFVLWLCLEALGIGLSILWYLGFCAVWVFGPWAVREIVHKYPGVWRVIGHALIAAWIGGSIGGLFYFIVSPFAGWIVGGAWAALVFGVLCICGTAQ